MRLLLFVGNAGWNGLYRGVLMLGMGLALLACGDDQAPQSAAPEAGPQGMADSLTIDHVLRTDDRFSTLAAALDSAGLDSVLRSDGPYTLFAPPNEAFEALPPGTVSALLTDRPDRLRLVLRQHIVPQREGIDGRREPWGLPTLADDSLRLVPTDTTVTVRNARVMDAGVETSNGVIHVVDRVLRPEEPLEEGPE
ncbi:MAG: fasciclin domain-containing protein [Salinibacter sp.]